MKRYCVDVTEAVSTEYFIEAKSKAEAKDKVLAVLGIDRPIFARVFELRNQGEFNDKISLAAAIK